MPNGFETEKYLTAQTLAFRDRIQYHDPSPALVEFGGKPFDDRHAERVLPGYDADCKAEVLKTLMPTTKMVMVINARDVLFPPEGRYKQGRIRGDSQLFYRDEVLRLILRARELNVRVDDVVISVSPTILADTQNKPILDTLQNSLAGIGVNSRRFYSIAAYPQVGEKYFDQYQETFEKNGQLNPDAKQGVTVFSPGGGSGKFGVLLSEAYFLLKQQNPPHYIKFETFPVFDLEADNALNLAFTIATADLKNKVISLGKNHSTYDKDVENFALLKWLFQKMGYGEELQYMQDPTHIGINRITDGVVNWDTVIEACRDEIARRIARYTTELMNGVESHETLSYAQEIAQIFSNKYPSTSKIFFLSP